MVPFYINGFVAPINIHILTNWIRKQDPSFLYIQKSQLRIKDLHCLSIKWQEITIPSHWIKDERKYNYLLSDKLIRRDRERHYIPDKGKIHWEDVSILNIYESNTRIWNVIKNTTKTKITFWTLHSDHKWLSYTIFSNRQVIHIQNWSEKFWSCIMS